MGEFNYNPGVQDRRGELLGAGIERGMDSLAAGIQQAEQKRKENKAYAQLAETLGLDPKHATKQTVQAAILNNEIQTQRQQAQREQKSRAALGQIAQTFLSARKPQANITIPPLGQTFSRAVGDPGSLLGTPKPGASVSDALAKALAANPDVFNDNKSAATALNMTKMLSQMGDTSPQTVSDPNSGAMFVKTASGWRPIPKSAITSQPSIISLLSKQDMPDGGGYAYFKGNNAINPRDIIGGPAQTQKTGRYPKGTKFTDMGNDTTQAVFPDGSTDIVRQPADDEFGQIMQQAKGESGAKTNAPEAEAENTSTEGNGENGDTQAGALPKVTTQEQFDALESGAQYIGQDGQTYQKS